MRKQFNYEFEENEPDTMHLEYSPKEDEQLEVIIENNVPILYLNRSGLLTLAKVFIKIALGPYSDKYHQHLNEDFNADNPERLTIMLRESDKK